MSGSSFDIVSPFVDNLVALILGELGEDAVLAVFAGGSVARGEISYRLGDDGMEVYSDVDLYVVVKDGVALEEVRRRGRESVAGVPLVGKGYRFFRAPDVGVYSFADLAAQPARPGTVGLGEHHLLLYGDADIPLRAAASIGSDIASEEALYLLENRLIELLALENRRRAGEHPVDDGYYAFVVCKTGLDVATAALIARGMYSASRAERVRLLEAAAGEAGVGEASETEWASRRLDLVKRCAEAFDRMPSPDWASSLAEDGTENAVVFAALTQWKRAATEHLSAHSDDWASMVLSRCSIGEYVNNFRRFRALNTRCRFLRRGALAAGIHLARYSPIDALRLSGLTEYLYRDEPVRPGVEMLEQTLGAYLDRLTRECGFVSGSLAERSFAMYQAAQ